MNYKSVTYHQLLTYANNYGTQVIDWEHCTLGENMGAGSAMNVFSGKCKINGEERGVAFKILVSKLSSETHERKRNIILKDVEQELHILGMLKGHPQIAQLLGVSFSDHNPILILELAKSSLEEYLQVGGGETGIDWDTKQRFAYEIIDAVAAIHKVGVVHGDLKASNILIYIEASNHAVAKVSDFGYSATELSIEQGQWPGGTYIFRAPEFFEDNLKDWKGKSSMDIYSYGLLVWQIVMDGVTPFEDKELDDIDDMKRNETILSFLMEKIPEDTPKNMRKIIEMTVVNDPRKRASTEEIMKISYSIEGVKEVFEILARQVPLDAKETIWVSKLEKLPIPLTLRKSIFFEYQSLANEGDMIAMSRLGSCWRFGFGTEKNIDKAFECFKKAAEGYLPAQTELGFCYFNGEGVKKDPVKAFELFMSAATEANDPLAQFNVGFCYEDGRGVSHNQEKAIRFYEKAAEAGIFQAQYNLGICYINGKGVTKDTEKAIELFTKAAEADYTPAQCYLGFCYASGLGLPQDYLKCAELYKKAALSGDASAQYDLGDMYFKGIGVPQDLKEARKYFEMAAEQENLDAKQILDYLNSL